MRKSRCRFIKHSFKEYCQGTYFAPRDTSIKVAFAQEPGEGSGDMKEMTKQEDR